MKTSAVDVLTAAKSGAATNVVFLFASLALAAVLLFSSYVFFKAFQQRGYHKTGYINWLAKSKGNYTLRLLNVCLFGLVSYVVFSVLFAPYGKRWLSLVGLLFSVIFLVIFQKSSTNKNERQSLVFTWRMKRLYAVSYVLTAAIVFAVFYFADKLENADVSVVIKYVRYAPVALMPILMPFVILLAYAVTYPYEQLVKRHFKKKAVAKFNSFAGERTVIGITGSYGKTSVKNFLATILAEKYSVMPSPASYNTPMGLAKAVLEGYKGERFFIAEMGARRRGDIKELCEMFTPSVAVVTAVARQHLESFKSFDNVFAAKYEIVENMQKDGAAFFSSDNDGSKKLYDKAPCEKYLAGLKGGDLTAENLVVSNEGSSFDIVYNGERAHAKTALLGEHNISNLLTASLVALKLGMTLDEIAGGIAKIKAVPHRLEVMKGAGGATIIDDSFNANPQSVRAALAALRLFSGRKLVITSGLIELDKMEDFENKCLGENMAKSCDVAVLIGSRRTLKIAEGLLENGFDKDNLYVVQNLSEAMKTLSEVQKNGDVILFMNDLPDTFIN